MNGIKSSKLAAIFVCKRNLSDTTHPDSTKKRRRTQLAKRTIASLILIMTTVSILAVSARARETAPPEEIVRGFYSWYLHQLNAENSNPLKQKASMLKYVTPQLYASAPRLIRNMDADIFICAQDWDKDWERNFSVTAPEIKNNSATATVTLPSGETDKININVTLLKTVAGWRISKVACAS
jgi:hypothetical protein